MMTIPDGATGRRRWRLIWAVEKTGLCGVNGGQVVEYKKSRARKNIGTKPQGSTLILAEIMSIAGAAYRPSQALRRQTRLIFSTHPCVLISVPINGRLLASSGLPESCPQNGDLPKSPFTHRQR